MGSRSVSHRNPRWGNVPIRKASAGQTFEAMAPPDPLPAVPPPANDTYAL